MSKKKLKPKDKHQTAWWKRRDDRRKPLQDAYAAKRQQVHIESDVPLSVETRAALEDLVIDLASRLEAVDA